MVKITSLNHSGCEPCWSPDGGHIVYSDHETYSIFIVDVNGPEKSYIGFGESPMWLPGSQQIIYRMGSGIYQADLGANKPEKIYESAKKTYTVTEFAISNDGKNIAFVEEDFYSKKSRLCMMNERDGSVSILVEQAQFIKNVSWSSDDRRLTYTSKGGIRLFDRQNEREDILAEKGNYSAWSPVSDIIAYTEGSFDERGSIVFFDIRTQRSSRVRLRESLFEIHVIPSYWLIWSPNGKFLAFERRIMGKKFNRGKAQESSICVLQISDGKIHTIFNDRSETFSKVTWSPDSSKLAAVLVGNRDFILHVADLT